MKNSLCFLILVAMAMFYSACAQRPSTEKTPVDSLEPQSEVLEPELSDKAVQGLRSLIDEVEKAILPEVSPSKNSLETPATAVSETIQFRNERVQFWFNYFTIRDRARFQRFLNRGRQYQEMVQTVLEENGVPNELYFLAMIESGYATHAYSRASAVGVWQFIAATGRRYGLTYNYYLDERREPIMATEAAVKYLRDLYNAFLSWELSMAAYNAGELRILRAIMDNRSRDFWTLAKNKKLPKETRNYVPKFIAAAIIGRDPQKYGFDDPRDSVESYPSVIAVEVPSPIRLRDIAESSGIKHDLIKKLNPHIRRSTTPANTDSYEIWIPESEAEKVIAVKGQLAKLRMKSRGVFDDPDGKKYHVVRSGENLSVIAKRYRVSVRSLKRINGLSNNRIHPGRKLRITTASYTRPSSGGSRYRVRSGDSLGLIAQRYSTTVSQLKAVNGLKNSKIRIGQVLVLPGRKIAHDGRIRVKHGDTLEKLARRYGMTIRRLKSLNDLKRNTIYVGEWLKISQKNP